MNQRLTSSWIRRPFWRAFDFYALAFLTSIRAYDLFDRSLSNAVAVRANERIALFALGSCAVSMIAATAYLIERTRKLLSDQRDPEVESLVFRWRVAVFVFAFLFFGALT